MRLAHGCASGAPTPQKFMAAARCHGRRRGCSAAPSAGWPAALRVAHRKVDVAQNGTRHAAHPLCAPHPQSNFYIDPSTLAAGVCDGADDTPSAAARPVRAYPALHVAKALPYHADTHPRARLPLPCALQDRPFRASNFIPHEVALTTIRSYVDVPQSCCSIAPSHIFFKTVAIQDQAKHCK